MGIIEDAIKSQKEIEELKSNPGKGKESGNNTSQEKSEKPENESQEQGDTGENTKEEFIKWFYELDKNSGSVAGGKGANLGEMYNNKIPVPPGFVVTAQAYDYFIRVAGMEEKIKEILDSIDYEDTKQLNEATEKIRKLITNSNMPKEMQEEIKEAYSHLDAPESASKEKKESQGTALDILQSSAEPVFVAVRSSATTEDLENASFAGQQETYLNIKGDDDLIRNVKKCFASLFTARATYYRNKKGFPHGESKLAVIVQKMVDSKKSGVSFSKDPTGKTDDTIIEAVWGLGEGIVSGQVTPDKYVVSKGMEIKDKKIANKKVAITRKASGERAVVKVNEEKANHQVLTDHEIKRMTEISLRLEDHYNKPQDIEFAIENEEIYIVQTRPVTTIKEKKSGEESDEETEISGDEIISGLGASPGVAVGKVKIIENLEDLDKIKEGDILVTGMTNPDMVVAMQRSSGIVTDEGGMTAHAAIVSREMGIPCIVGTEKATEVLEDGQEITVDGNSGKVFRGKVAEETKKEIKPVEAETKTEIKTMVDLPSFAKRAAKTGLKKAGLTRIEGIIAESGKHPQHYIKNQNMREYEDVVYNGIKDIAEHFEEMWVRTSDIRTNEYKNLEGAPQEPEDNPMLGMHGVRYSLKHPEILKSEFRAMNRAAKDKGTKFGFLLPQLISVEELSQVKGILKEMNISDIKVGVMIETPASVQIIKSLCEEGIDFVSFGTNDLTQYILAVDRGNTDVQELYDEMHPAITHQLGFVIRVCKRAGVETSICGQAGSKKPMVKYLVKQGIDSISVNADMAAEIADYVSVLEQGKDPDEEERFDKRTEKEEIQNKETENEFEQQSKKEQEQNHEFHNPENQNKKEETKENYIKGKEAVQYTEKEKQNYEHKRDQKQEQNYGPGQNQNSQQPSEKPQTQQGQNIKAIEQEKQRYENNQQQNTQNNQEYENKYNENTEQKKETKENYIKGQEAIEKTEQEKQRYENNQQQNVKDNQEKQRYEHNNNQNNFPQKTQNQEQVNNYSWDDKDLDELEKQKKKAEESGQKFSAQTNPPEKVQKNIEALKKERQDYEKTHPEEPETNEENIENTETEKTDEGGGESEDYERGPLENDDGSNDSDYEEESGDFDEEETENDSYHTENLDEDEEDEEEYNENGVDEENEKEDSDLGIFN